MTKQHHLIPDMVIFYGAPFELNLWVTHEFVGNRDVHF